MRTTVPVGEFPSRDGPGNWRRVLRGTCYEREISVRRHDGDSSKDLLDILSAWAGFQHIPLYTYILLCIPTRILVPWQVIRRPSVGRKGLEDVRGPEDANPVQGGKCLRVDGAAGSVESGTGTELRVGNELFGDDAYDDDGKSHL